MSKIEKELTCSICSKKIIFELIFDKENELVDTSPPLICECGSNVFNAMFSIDTEKWNMAYGTNGD